LKILLDEIMYSKNLSVRQVSIMTGIPKSTVYDIMTGRKIPRIDTLEVIAAGLKIRISDLYESPYK
jgi:transcriptional regulator with XRE-family HTH domain